MQVNIGITSAFNAHIVYVFESTSYALYLLIHGSRGAKDHFELLLRLVRLHDFLGPRHRGLHLDVEHLPGLESAHVSPG